MQLALWGLNACHWGICSHALLVYLEKSQIIKHAYTSVVQPRRISIGFDYELSRLDWFFSIFVFHPDSLGLCHFDYDKARALLGVLFFRSGTGSQATLRKNESVLILPGKAALPFLSNPNRCQISSDN